jgi:quercetin dioxygenase-like cupin family protein
MWEVTMPDKALPEQVRKGPLPMRFGYYPIAEAKWRRSGRINLEFRDMGLAGNTEGTLDAQHVRATGGQGGNRRGWYASETEFLYLHMMGGTLRLETTDGKSISLKSGDTLILPPFNLRDDVFEYSSDFEALEFWSLGAFQHIEASEKAIGHKLLPVKTEGVTVDYEGPDSYKPGAGLRRFFSYRDIGANEATGGRIHIHIVGIAGDALGGTGWHTHTMDQFFMPMIGHLDIAIEPLGRSIRIGRGDAVYIPAGIRHDVTGFSKNYFTTEVCIPNDYDTTPVEGPFKST